MMANIIQLKRHARVKRKNIKKTKYLLQEQKQPALLQNKHQYIQASCIFLQVFVTQYLFEYHCRWHQDRQTQFLSTITLKQLKKFMRVQIFTADREVENGVTKTNMHVNVFVYTCCASRLASSSKSLVLSTSALRTHCKAIVSSPTTSCSTCNIWQLLGMPSIACMAMCLRKVVFPVPFLPTRPEKGIKKQPFRQDLSCSNDLIS